jgi:hypothetical protein
MALYEVISFAEENANLMVKIVRASTTKKEIFENLVGHVSFIVVRTRVQKVARKWSLLDVSSPFYCMKLQGVCRIIL